MTAPEPTVFIVDDDRDVLQSFHSMFSAMNLPVATFFSGREFLEAVQHGQPGCVIIDMRMSEMDGLELQREINRRSLGLTVIIISGGGTDDIRDRAMVAGALACLEKPVKGKDLTDLVRQGLEKSVEMSA